MFDVFLNTAGSLDGVFNNAGITGSTETLWNYDLDEWKRVLDINLLGTFHCCKCVIPIMKIAS